MSLFDAGGSPHRLWTITASVGDFLPIAMKQIGNKYEGLSRLDRDLADFAVGGTYGNNCRGNHPSIVI